VQIARKERMYKIRVETSQDGEYTATFLKDEKGRDNRIGNWEGVIILELQDKLSRRNMQIKDLKKEKENLQATLGEAVYFINQKGFYPEFDKSLTTRH
jgi:hypothetical protein